MANDGFDGTYVAHGANTVNGTLRSVSYSQNANPVDITGSTSTRHQVVAGITSHTISFEEIGYTALSIGDSAQFTITWFDGSSDVLATMLVTSVEISGDLDGAITSSVELQPTNA